MQHKTLWMVVLAAWMAATSAGQYRKGTVEEHRQRRNELLGKGARSPLSLVYREYFKGKTRFVIGSSAQADLRLTGNGIAPQHATVVVQEGQARIHAESGTLVKNGAEKTVQEQDLNREPEFRIGDYVLNYRPAQLAQGIAIDVYDSSSRAKQQFRSLDFFPNRSEYNVLAQLTQQGVPEKINLIDSKGFDRPYWIYGHLTFRVKGTELKMEVYTPTLEWSEIEREGFMLIFGDTTNGKETYSSGRYLYIEGKPSGTVEVDFNKSQNPPCAFSPVFTCPFPRKQNRLPVAIAAGEKKYTGLAAQPLNAP